MPPEMIANVMPMARMPLMVALLDYVHKVPQPSHRRINQCKYDNHDDQCNENPYFADSAAKIHVRPCLCRLLFPFPIVFPPIA